MTASATLLLRPAAVFRQGSPARPVGPALSLLAPDDKGDGESSESFKHIVRHIPLDRRVSCSTGPGSRSSEMGDVSKFVSGDASLGVKLNNIRQGILTKLGLRLVACSCILSVCLSLLVLEFSTEALGVRKFYFDGLDLATKPRTGTSLNHTKVATMLEPRMSPILIPLIASYLSVVPEDWPFVVWCSEENYGPLSQSATLARQIETGRLNLTLMPSTIDIHSGEYLSRFLTKPWWWHQFHRDAEWMLFFQSDAVLCSASEHSVDDWLGYDWVGSPTLWSDSRGHGGNGGLGMRRISTMQAVTDSTEFVRDDWTGDAEVDGGMWGNAEDYWFMKAIDRMFGTRARWPEQDGRDQNTFSATMNSADLRPLGVHKGSGPLGILSDGAYDGDMDIDAAIRRLVRYCPEITLIIDDEDGRFG